MKANVDADADALEAEDRHEVAENALRSMKSESRIKLELEQVAERVASVRFLNAAQDVDGPADFASPPSIKGKRAPSMSKASFSRISSFAGTSSASKSFNDWRGWFNRAGNLYDDEKSEVKDSFLTALLFQLKGIWRVVKFEPWVLIAPLLVLGLCVGLGVWGVLAASSQQTTTYKADVDKAAQSTIISIQNAINQAYAPATLLRDMVSQYPDWTTLSSKFDDLAAQLLQFNGAKDTTSLELVPFGFLGTDYPAHTNPLPYGHDFLDMENQLHRGVMIWTIMNPSAVLLTGPYVQYAGDKTTPMSIDMRTISTVFVKNVSRDETFNAPFNLSSATNCMDYPCYINATRSKYWGSIGCTVSFLGLQKTHGWAKLDTDQGFNFRLSRYDVYIFETIELMRSRSLPVQPIVYNLPTLNGNWTLEISRQSGWVPAWKWPLVAAVVIIAVILSCLLFLLQVKQRQHTNLLTAIVPKQVIPYLSAGKTYAKSFENLTVLFSDIVGYTSMSSNLTAEQVAELLNEVYALYDKAARQLGMHRVDIIGDAYLAVAGCPIKEDRVAAAVRAVRMAQAMIDITRVFRSKTGVNVRIRVGLHSGPAVAVVLGGHLNPKFTLLGDTVNTSSRMESNSLPMRVHVSQDTADLLTLSGIALTLEDRGEMEIKGKGLMHTFFVDEKSSYLATADKYKEDLKKEEMERKAEKKPAATFHDENLTVEV